MTVDSQSCSLSKHLFQSLVYIKNALRFLDFLVWSNLSSQPFFNWVFPSFVSAQYHFSSDQYQIKCYYDSWLCEAAASLTFFLLSLVDEWKTTIGSICSHLTGGFPAYLYSSSCSLTAERRRRRTVGMSERGWKEEEEEREGEAGCQDESVPFVCCNEFWDIKDDRS